jgi:hypothetical protein
MSSRRKFIQHTALATAALSVSPLAGFSIIKNKSQDEADVVIGHGGFTYKVDKGWAKMSLNSNPLINCHEMVHDSKGRLIMIGDHTNNNILIFDKSGNLLDFWGHSFPGGHGLTLSKEGSEDFLFIVDCGYYQDKYGKGQSQAGQVIKTDLTGRIIYTLGHPRTIGIYKDNEKFQPTETAVAPNGDLYVADGYGSDYIIQYNQKGQYIRHFGGRNNANPEHNLINAHGVAVDNRNPANPTLICTSREENCFKVFTLDGKFIKRIDLPGLYVCRPVMQGENIYAGVCWSKDDEGNRLNNSGFVTILSADNKVVSNPGGTEPVYQNGVLKASKALTNRVFNHGHDVCVDNDLNLYVCQWNANHTTPIKLTRV